MALSRYPLVERPSVDPGSDRLVLYVGDTISDRPASAATGDMFYSPDRDLWYVWNGSSWRSTNGGGADSQLVVADATQTISANTGNNDDDDLQVSLAASTNYAFRLVAFWDTPAAADVKCRLTASVAGTLRAMGYSSPAGSTARNGFTWNAFDTDRGITGTGTTGASVRLFGWILTGGSATTVKFQWGQNSSDAGNTVRLAGAYLYIVSME